MNGGLIFARKSQFTSQFFALWWRGRCGKKDQLPLWATLFASWSAASDGASTSMVAVRPLCGGAQQAGRAARPAARRGADPGAEWHHFF